MTRMIFIFLFLSVATGAEANTRQLFNELGLLPQIEERLMARLSRSEPFRLLLGICGPARSEPMIAEALKAAKADIQGEWDVAIDAALTEIPNDDIQSIIALDSREAQANRGFSALANGPGQAISRATLPLVSRGAERAGEMLSAVNLETCSPIAE